MSVEKWTDWKAHDPTHENCVRLTTDDSTVTVNIFEPSMRVGEVFADIKKKQMRAANRIVACVNGCKGLNPEAFADLAKSHTELLRIIEENRMVGLNQGSEYVPHIAAALSAEMRVHAKGEAK